LFIKYGVIVGGIFISIFGVCLFIAAMIWVVIEYKTEEKVAKMIKKKKGGIK